jgi:hypothetical protein
MLPARGGLRPTAARPPLPTALNSARPWQQSRQSSGLASVRHYPATRSTSDRSLAAKSLNYRQKFPGIRPGPKPLRPNLQPISRRNQARGQAPERHGRYPWRHDRVFRQSISSDWSNRMTVIQPPAMGGPKICRPSRILCRIVSYAVFFLTFFCAIGLVRWVRPSSSICW